MNFKDEGSSTVVSIAFTFWVCVHPNLMSLIDSKRTDTIMYGGASNHFSFKDGTCLATQRDECFAKDARLADAVRV